MTWNREGRWWCQGGGSVGGGQSFWEAGGLRSLWAGGSSGNGKEKGGVLRGGGSISGSSILSNIGRGAMKVFHKNESLWLRKKKKKG